MWNVGEGGREFFSPQKNSISIFNPSVCGKVRNGGCIVLPLFDLLIKILPFGLDRRFIIGGKTRGSSLRWCVVTFVTVLFVSAGAERGDDRSSAASQPPPPPPPSVASFSWYLGDFASLYLPTYQPNRYSTRLVSIRFASLSLSLRDGDEDVTPSRTGSSTGSFASQPRSNRSIALRSVLRIPPVDLPPRTRLRNYRT